jgi:hypothetical protein
MISFHIWLFKKLIHTLQKNVHMLSFLFGNGFTPVLDSSHPLAENRHPSASQRELANENCHEN